MCGIAGFYTPSGFDEYEARINVEKMRDQLVHRGPDDAGAWLDGNAGIALGHRRLSIIDLSEAGHQPMVSACQRYILIFNGEIYNHHDTRTKLENTGYNTWRGHSDTETLLAAISQWGIQHTLKISVGMFSLALWDREERSLYLARDRMGEKPLYYGWQSGTLLFASEMKSLRQHPRFQNQINRNVVPIYLRHGYIPTSGTVWQGIHKLKPGTMIRFSMENGDVLPEPVQYWSLTEIIYHAQSDLFCGSDEDAIDALEEQLGQAIKDQMVADVPLGAFLSGGVDSSSVVALMQVNSSRPVKTFTIGFSENDYNEAEHARQIAAYLGTDHTELYLSSRQIMDVIPKLPQIYDEPFGDSSAIPTHLVSQLARSQVAVSMSGDGGDELFAGYGRYQKAEKAISVICKAPLPIRRHLASLLRTRFVARMAKLSSVNRLKNSHNKARSISAKCAMLANLLECTSENDLYHAMISQWNPVPIMGKPDDYYQDVFTHELLSLIPEAIQRMMAADSLTYLPDDILMKVDRAAMAASLETRVPLLDHRVIELVWRMPYDTKMRAGKSKWILKRLLSRYLPDELYDRPKQGFGLPLDDWLRGPLRDWAESLLDESRLREEGFLDPKPIRARWDEHLQGHNNWKDSLWLVLMWQAWLEKTVH